MAEQQVNIIVVPPLPILNAAETTPFAIMQREHSCQLYSTLYCNTADNLFKLPGNFRKVFCLDAHDREFSGTINLKMQERVEFQFIDPERKTESLRHLMAHYTQDVPFTILLRPFVMDLRQGMFAETINFLNYDDSVCCAGRSKYDTICFTGVNALHPSAFSHFTDRYYSYDHYLRSVSAEEYRSFEVRAGWELHDWGSFIDLYRFLSTKQSEEFNSRERHEALTELFIEFKDFL